jgi:hypothetical protein
MTHRAGIGFAIAMFLVALAPPALAQPAGSTTLSGTVGLGFRGAGEVGLCCGPFVSSDLEQPASIGFGGSVAHWFTDRAAVQAEASASPFPSVTPHVDRSPSHETHVSG